MSIVGGTRAFLGVLRRLHATNDAVVFGNHDKTLQIMLRNDPDTDERIGFEVCLVASDDTVRRGLEFEHSGYYDNSDMFVLDGFSFDRLELEARPDQVLERAIQFVNTVYLFSVCACGRLIKDDAKLCMFCHLTSRDSELESEFCFVCHESGPRKVFKHLSCCKQFVHQSCADRWRATARDDRCPHCRRDGFTAIMAIS